jgi:hypothetical protein
MTLILPAALIGIMLALATEDVISEEIAIDRHTGIEAMK